MFELYLRDFLLLSFLLISFILTVKKDKVYFLVSFIGCIVAMMDTFFGYNSISIIQSLITGFVVFLFSFFFGRIVPDLFGKDSYKPLTMLAFFLGAKLMIITFMLYFILCIIYYLCFIRKAKDGNRSISYFTILVLGSTIVALIYDATIYM